MSRLTVHTLDSAPAEAKERVFAAQKSNGFLPNLIGVLAGAPTALEAYQVVGAINARNSLTAAEREVIQISAATLNGCGFCVAGHTAVARKKLHMPEKTIEALRGTQALTDPKLNALAQFTIAVIENRGRVSNEQLSAFLTAGYSQANALDVVLGVSLAALCNYANGVARTPINQELDEFV